MEEDGYKEVMQQEYVKLTKREGVTLVAQTTINTLNTVIRNKLIENIEMCIERPTAITTWNQ